MRPLTPQQIADAAAKRRATQAAKRAAGLPSVRQQRAAARAAKAGQPYAPPAPRASAPPKPSNGFGRRRRRSRFHHHVPNPTPQGPVFSTPKPSYRPLKLAALVALEDVFVQKLAESGITDDLRAAYTQYKKVKTLALGVTTSDAMRNEADTALRLATVQLVKLSF